jgi:hypothetical protein
VKYINHINLLLAVVGVAVVLYALSQTFFSPPRQATIDIQELQRRGSQEAAQRRSTDPVTIFRGAATTQISSSEVSTSRPPRQPAVVGVPRVDPTRGIVGASPRPGIQDQRLPGSSPVRIGQRPETAAPVPFVVQEDGLDIEDDDVEARPQRPRTGALTQPPVGVEAEKRDAGSDPPAAPPVRSSMPVRRPQ